MSASLFLAPGTEGFQPSKLSPGQDALDEGWTPWLPETPAFDNFLSLKYSLPLDSPRSHKL